MANITKIKAKDSTPAEPKKPKAKKSKSPSEKSEKPKKKPFLLFRPFVALGTYLRDSWRELRQVRWPNRKTTWKLVLAVFVYTLVFVGFLVLLDIIFDLLFSKLLG